MPQLHLDVAHNLRRRALRGETFLSLFFPFSFLTNPRYVVTRELLKHRRMRARQQLDADILAKPLATGRAGVGQVE